MTNILSGSDLKIFCDKEDVLEHLLGNVLANKKRKVGTEWEMFFVKSNGQAISCIDGQKAFADYKRLFAIKGYKSSYIYECASDTSQTIFGLEIEGLGCITPEMGHQFEFACSVSENCDEIREKNEEFYRVTLEVARGLNYLPVFKGHIPGYVGTTEGSYRSRSIEWRKYFKKRYDTQAIFVREALDATASIQVTIDSGADKFHEFFQTLLLIEPAFNIYFANSNRPNISVQRLSASHMKPVVDVWGTKTPREALRVIVDRLMEVDVPFLPDPEFPDLYKAEPLAGNRPPNVELLMKQGRLNEKTLNNVGGFLLSRPALRRFNQGLIEMRGIDSQPSPDKIREVVMRVTSLVYDDETRKNLLNAYSYLTVSDIRSLHDIASMSNRNDALNFKIAGIKMPDFIDDIISRSNPNVLDTRRWLMLAKTMETFAGVQSLTSRSLRHSF